MNAQDSKLYINQLREEYIDNHIKQQERDLLIAENNIEKRDIKGYHGREILELLQNADDAYQKSIDIGEKPNCELLVEISYLNNALRITNTGTFFDKNGIKAIVQGNNSPKAGKYIGNKGTGFRSILNWANKVRIFSGNFSVEFSKEIAKKVLLSIKEQTQIKKQITKNPDLYIPMLAVPQNIENTGNKNVTTIEIEIDSEKTKDDFSVEKQLDNIDLRILLFLPNISQIHIITASRDIIYKRQIIEDEIKTICLRKIVSMNLEIEEHFYVFGEIIPKAIKEDQEEKDILLSIAVPKDFSSFDSKHLYSFFPLLNTESPFNCIMHASYFLDDHRNTIILNEGNKTIIEEQVKFLIDVAETFIHNGQYECAYKILVPKNFSTDNWHFPTPFQMFKMESLYLDLLSNHKLFQTVNEECVSVLDKPKFIEGTIPNVFKGDGFSKLLSPIKDENMHHLLLELYKRKGYAIDYNEEELCSIIDSKSYLWNISEQVDVFIWWNSQKKFSHLLPKLLKSQYEQWLTFKDNCFFLVGNFDDVKLPSWVVFSALHLEYQKELFLQSEKNTAIIKIRETETEPQISRVISKHGVYPSVNFKYLDRSSIISAVNSSVDTYDKAIDFIKWLWSNYKNEDLNWTPPDNIRYNFPCKKEIVKDSKKLYFGDKYNNPLAEKLFDNDYDAFPEHSVFFIEFSDVDYFQRFIKKFGVKQFPEIDIKEIDKPIDTFQRKCEERIKERMSDASEALSYVKYKLPYIYNLDNLLECLSTENIIEWILKDSTFFTYITNPLSSNSEIVAYFHKKYARNKPHQYFGPIDNYILELLNEKEWIEIKGERYSPRQVLQGFKTNSKTKFEKLTPVLTIGIVESYAKNLNVDVDKIREILGKFDFCDKITDLESNSFYGLLLQIPNIEFSIGEKMFKAIYNIVEQPSFNKTYTESENKNKYFSEGKILVKYHGQLQYYKAKNSFLPSSKIVVKKEVPIVEKGARTNNDKFIRVFGCQEYNNDYSIEKDSISLSNPANSKFQTYFDEFKKYAFAFSNRNRNIEDNVRRLDINLVDKILITINGTIKPVEEEYICLRDTTTNWYVTVYEEIFNINLMSEIIETIYSNIANTPGFDADACKIGELFRARDRADREFLIKKEFGSLCVIDDESYSNDIKNNFINTIKSISENYDTETIEINFENFSNADIQKQNAPVIIKLFKEINTDVENLKNAGFVYKIDLIPYYKKQLSEFIESEKRKFKDYKYTMALDNNALQNDFIRFVNDFENFQLSDSDYENSVYFDVKNKVVEKFGSWDCCDKIVSAEEKYPKNYEYMNPNKMFEDDIANNNKVQTMIYFNRTNEFNDWLSEMQNKQAKEEQENKVDAYSQYRGVIPAKEDIKYDPNNNYKPGHSHGKRNGAITDKGKEEEQKNKKEKGDNAELVIYNKLCEQFGKENVYPRSEAFVRLGIIKPGQAISGGYDLSYIDKTGKEYYVEVKNGDDNLFFISPNELQFAKENSNNYKLYIVHNINKNDETPVFNEAPPKFWDDDKFRRRDIIEKIEFRF